MSAKAKGGSPREAVFSRLRQSMFMGFGLTC